MVSEWKCLPWQISNILGISINWPQIANEILFPILRKVLPFWCLPSSNCHLDKSLFNCSVARKCIIYNFFLVVMYLSLYIEHSSDLTWLYVVIYFLYFSFKGNILQQIISVEFILELINTVPFFVTVSGHLRIDYSFIFIIYCFVFLSLNELLRNIKNWLDDGLTNRLALTWPWQSLLRFKNQEDSICVF